MSIADDRKVSAWSTHAVALAAWHHKNVVNRSDAYGRYIRAESRGDGDSAITDKSGLTFEVLQFHFMGRSTGDLVGLHSTARDEPEGEGEVAACWSKWGAVDIDLHDGRGDPGANLRFALALYVVARDLGFRPLLYDSNGRGGYHLVLLFGSPTPTEKVFAFLRWLVRDWKAAGLDEEPETFPKQAGIKAGGYGNWLRCPGRHHTHEHWTRVWDGDREQWLEDTSAVRYILETTGTPADVIPAEALTPPTREKAGGKVAQASTWDMPVKGTAMGRYVARALAEEVANVINAPERQRNIQLNKSAFALGQLVGPELSRGDVERNLRTVAKGIGLGDDEIEKTLASGIESGMLEPRDLSHVGQLNGHHLNGSARPKAKPLANGNGNGAAHVTVEPGDDEPEDDAEDEVLDRWPKPQPLALYGLAGDVVRALEPHTEADPMGMLIQLMVAFGNMIGRRPHFAVGATRHRMNLFAALVGPTASGRKGTAWDMAHWAISPFDHEWANQRIQGGLVSGEGLIHHVRDAAYEIRETKEKGVVRRERVMVDAGVDDKRLLILETEMGRVLKAMNRDANTTSDVVRQAWEKDRLAVMGKHKGAIATGAHISIIGHITRADISKHMADEDMLNGFGNRFIWVAVRRSKELPDGGDIYSREFGYEWEPIKHRLEQTIAYAKEVDRMDRDLDARRIWKGLYGGLTSGKPGRLGAVLSRAEPQVMRIACIYALLDQSSYVHPEHLSAAVALWDYCEASARYTFGDAFANPAGEKLMEALKAAPEGLERTLITTRVFGGNKTRAEINGLLSEMLTEGLIHRTKVKGGKGRPKELWRAGRGQ